MPGVPTGKACNACRKSKKKCDEQQPICSRCRRLRLNCVGGGVQRYRFMQMHTTTKPSTIRERTTPPQKQHYGDDADEIARSKSSPFARSTSSSATATPSLRFNLSNEQTRLVNSIVPIIHSSTDLRYNLWWSFGIFFEDVPQRLGSNEALDSAVDVVVNAHADYCLHRPVTLETLAKYSRALQALRVCLDDPVSALSSNTLCAVTILLICQFLISPVDDPLVSHAEGAARILVVREGMSPRDDFERKLLFGLTATVLCEALLNNRIHLTPQQWKTIVQSHISSETPEGCMFLILSRAPTLMQRGRHALHFQHDVTDLRSEAQLLYDNSKITSNVLRNRLIDNEVHHQSSFTTGLPHYHPDLMTNHYQRSYAFSLFTSIVFGCILAALDPDNSSSVKLESTSFAYEILGIVMQISSTCRPIGSGFLVFCLVAAWVGTTDAQLRLFLEMLLSDYQRDFSSWPLYQRVFLERTARHMHLGALISEDDSC